MFCSTSLHIRQNTNDLTEETYSIFVDILKNMAGGLWLLISQAEEMIKIIIRAL